MGEGLGGGDGCTSLRGRSRCGRYAPTPALPHRGGGSRRPGLPQRVGDRHMHAVEIGQHLIVPEPEEAIAFVLQECASLRFLRRRMITLTAIDFHHHPDLVADTVSTAEDA